MNALRWIGLIAALLIVVVAAVVGGFVMGQQVHPTPTPTPTVTHTPSRGFGTYAWNKLKPGDCLLGYTSPWQDSFTVVACDGQHTAQLLNVTALPSASREFPGKAALAAQVGSLCAAKDLYNSNAAQEYDHLLVNGTYPETAQEYALDPEYRCFVTAASGEMLTTDLMPQVN